MKKISVLFALFCITSAFGQSSYESAYVFNGETFQIEFPEGFFPIKEVNRSGKMIIYQSDTTTEFHHVDLENLKQDLLICTYTKSPALSLTEMLVKMERQLDIGDSDVDVTFLQKPELITRNGNEFAILGVKGSLDELKIESYYMVMIKFGDYFFGMVFIGPTKNSIVSTKDDLFIVLDSYKVVETKKENLLD